MRARSSQQAPLSFIISETVIILLCSSYIKENGLQNIICQYLFAKLLMECCYNTFSLNVEQTLKVIRLSKYSQVGNSDCYVSHTFKVRASVSVQMCLSV